jgi:hypothetical protein
MAKVNQNVRSGNRIVIQLDGKTVGLIQSVRMSDDYAPDAASGIGDIHVTEHVPTIARHSISVSTMVMKRATLRQLGIASENGDDALTGRVFDIVSYDKDTGEELRKYMGCTYASGDLEVNKHAIVMSSGTFMALDVSGIAA